jgi:hypothetical protein
LSHKTDLFLKAILFFDEFIIKQSTKVRKKNRNNSFCKAKSKLVKRFFDDIVPKKPIFIQLELFLDESHIFLDVFFVKLNFLFLLCIRVDAALSILLNCTTKSLTKF